MTGEEIQAIFFVECEESLAAAEAGLDACRDGAQDAETINAIFRAVHSIKGGAGAFGFSPLQAFTHGFETLLSDLRDGAIECSGSLVALMLRALDMLSDHVASARDGGMAPDDAAILAELEAAQAQGAQAQGAQIQGEREHVTPSDETPPEIPAADVVDLDFDLDAMLLDMSDPDESDAASGSIVTIKPLAGAMNNGGEPVLLLRELERLGGHCVACNTADVPALDQLDPRLGYLSWTFAVPADVPIDDVRELFDFVGEDCEVSIEDRDTAGPDETDISDVQALPAPAPATDAMPVENAAIRVPPVLTAVPSSPAPAAAPPAQGQSVRIDLAKLDRLIDVVGEIVIAQAMMAQRLSNHGLAAIEELAMLEGLTRDFQEYAMAIRAQPIGSVFSRVPRILRELEGTTGKRVLLQLSGETTELDKTVIERLGEPMTHLIRNAVDHGIETADERIAAGKPADGTLRISAEHRGGRILIRIADDGKGIDRARVFAKAVERGLVAADAHLSDEEVDALIFTPGFSTSTVVSNVSGRGVGMDVVRQNVKELGGRITIDSIPGKGTTFTLALPLTLAISDGMIVTVGDQTLVVPLAHVIESLRPEPAELQLLGNGRQMLNVRGKFIPVIPLDREVGAVGAISSPTEGVLIIVDTEAAGQAALLVDAICDQRQFVIKTLDTHYRAVDGVAGATILGDGRVALIVDVDGLVADMLAPTRLRDVA